MPNSENPAPSSPFSEARTQPELLTKVNSGRIPPLPTHISKELKEIVRSMLQLQVGWTGRLADSSPADDTTPLAISPTLHNGLA